MPGHKDTPRGYGLTYWANRKQLESSDQKILSWVWVVKEEIACPKCPYSLATIDDFGLNEWILLVSG